MAKGLLEVDATLDTRQFWPDGGSDADTTKVVVQPKSFRFVDALPRTGSGKVRKDVLRQLATEP